MVKYTFLNHKMLGALALGMSYVEERNFQAQILARRVGLMLFQVGMDQSQAAITRAYIRQNVDQIIQDSIFDLTKKDIQSLVDLIAIDILPSWDGSENRRIESMPTDYTSITRVRLAGTEMIIDEIDNSELEKTFFIHSNRDIWMHDVDLQDLADIIYDNNDIGDYDDYIDGRTVGAVTRKLDRALGYK